METLGVILLIILFKFYIDTGVPPLDIFRTHAVTPPNLLKIIKFTYCMYKYCFFFVQIVNLHKKIVLHK